MRSNPPSRARVAAAIVGVIVLLSSPGFAQAPPTTTTVPSAEDLDIIKSTLALAVESPPAPDDVFLGPAEAQLVVDEKAAARTAAEAAFTEADTNNLNASVAVLETTIAEQDAQKARDARAKTLAEEEETLSDLTVRAYVTGGDYRLESFRALLEGDTTDPQSGAKLMFEQVVEGQVEVTEEAEAQLKKAEKKLSDATKARKLAESLAASAQSILQTRTTERDDAVAAHVEAIAAFDAARTRLQRAPTGGQVPLEVALIGMPRLTGDDLASWFATSPYPQPKIATPIDQMADWFIEEGAKEGIRGDIAFAQAVLETGGFTNTDSYQANNFSGIGHCDSCAAGWAFPSAQLGVRAQIQLLKSYAVRAPKYTEPLVDRRLRGPAGCCPTWGDLTTVWATDPTYGPKVMGLYSSMVDHAIGRRAAGLDLDVTPLVFPDD